MRTGEGYWGASLSGVGGWGEGKSKFGSTREEIFEQCLIDYEICRYIQVG